MFLKAADTKLIAKNNVMKESVGESSSELSQMNA
jgi:hypothetical protein